MTSAQFLPGQLAARQVPTYDLPLWLGRQRNWCVVIPVINEGERIRHLLERMAIMALDHLADIIIVDGGSQDDSLNSALLSKTRVRALLVKHTGHAVGLSLAVYGLTQWFGWNIPAHGNGLWYFNPYAWQALFVLGGAAALHSQQPHAADPRPLHRQPLFMACASIAALSVPIALSWKWPALHDAFMPQWVSEQLYPISKTNLAPVRLVHFLALAYCVAKLIPTGPWVQHWLVQKVAMMGRYSLEIFCLSVVLAPLADMANALGDDRLPMQIATALAGLGLMLGLAQWLEWNKRLTSPSPTATATGVVSNA
ncbi:OpgC domain-containing protein [Pseudomonas silvicola]|nr:OpgC domain-containing protein [Pseudomonas silvicola]